MTDWIDIEEQRPADDQHVMIKGYFPFQTDATYLCTETGGFEFVRTSNIPYVRYIFNGVTHWKPIND